MQDRLTVLSSKNDWYPPVQPDFNTSQLVRYLGTWLTGSNITLYGSLAHLDELFLAIHWVEVARRGGASLLVDPMICDLKKKINRALVLGARSHGDQRCDVRRFSGGCLGQHLHQDVEVRSRRK